MIDVLRNKINQPFRVRGEVLAINTLHLTSFDMQEAGFVLRAYPIKNFSNKNGNIDKVSFLLTEKNGAKSSSLSTLIKKPELNTAKTELLVFPSKPFPLLPFSITMTTI